MAGGYSMNLHELKAAGSALPESERLELAEYLLNSLHPETDAEDAEFERTIARRVDEIRARTVVGVPAEEVFERLRRKRS
jgi:putative addiction module component (TIGR02574 family)